MRLKLNIDKSRCVKVTPLVQNINIIIKKQSFSLISQRISICIGLSGDMLPNHRMHRRANIPNVTNEIGDWVIRRTTFLQKLNNTFRIRLYYNIIEASSNGHLKIHKDSPKLSMHNRTRPQEQEANNKTPFSSHRTPLVVAIVKDVEKAPSEFNFTHPW